MSNDFTGHRKVNIYDFDGVITCGLCPLPGDIIVTGRGYDECEFVYEQFDRITRAPGYSREFAFYFNPKTRSMGRTRLDSGIHKARTIQGIILSGVQVGLILEDDPTQYAEIWKMIEDLHSSSLIIQAYKPSIVFVNSYWTKK